MKFFTVLAFVSAVAAIAVRQSLPPQCALSCLTTTDPHGCSMTDNSCLCRNSQFIADQSACITKACTNPSDLQQADAFALQNCLAVGVTLTASNIPSATGSVASPSGTSSSSSSSSTSTSTTSSNGGSTLHVTTPAILLGVVAGFALGL